jgi:L-lysine 2,3-aminomutase
MLPVPHSITSDSAFEASSDASAGGSWQRELAGAVRSADELLRRLGLVLPPESLETAMVRLGISDQNSDHLRRFPVLVPENFLKRMRPGDASDPLLRQVLPLADESTIVDGFVSDAVGDLAARRTDGLIQKYEGRVLLIAASACAVHCRYCFRREYPYEAEPRRLDDWQPAISEIASDSSITEVIFSGGDPWMLMPFRTSNGFASTPGSLSYCRRESQVTF